MKLLEQTRQVCRTKHYSPRTEDSYIRWIERFLRFHRDTAGQWIHPRDMSAEHVEAFLTHLAARCRVAASTPYGTTLELQAPSPERGSSEGGTSARQA